MNWSDAFFRRCILANGCKGWHAVPLIHGLNVSTLKRTFLNGCLRGIQFWTTAPVPFRLEPEWLRIQHEMCADSLVIDIPAVGTCRSPAPIATVIDIDHPTVGIHSDLHDLPIGQFKGIGGMQHDMFIVIGFRDIDGLTVIHPDS